MELKISYRHLDSTPAIEEKVQQKAEKLKKYFDGKIYVDWTCGVEGDVHLSEVTVLGDHFTYHASGRDSNLYRTLDDVVQKLEKQLRKKKELTRDKIHRKGIIDG